MKVFASLLVGALFAGEAFAAWGLSKHIYNKWNENELQTWLRDHDIPYPTPADQKELQNLVKENWEDYVVTPYYKWDSEKLSEYLQQKGIEVQDSYKDNKNWLQSEVKKNWYETEAKAEEGYGDAKTWVFDTWTESQLKSFLDYNGIPSPTPRTRDALLQTARSNYQSIANKAGEAAAYPGDWVYKSWSNSDLKNWADTNGYPAPQPKNRDKLIANIRRNSRIAGLKYEETKNQVAEKTFNAWSDSELKQFLDKNGVPVPQNGKRDEMLALARKNKAYLTGDTFSASVASAYGAATSSVSSVFSQATEVIYDTGNKVADAALATWSDTRLKAYLDARGVAVPQNGKRDELLAAARRAKYQASTMYGGHTFETWSLDNLKEWFAARGDDAASAATGTRDELAASAASAYSVAASAASSGSNAAYDSLTSALAQATATVRQGTFDTWTDSELKNYLDSYGVKTYQGTTKNELVAKARRCAHLFQTGWVQESPAQKYQRLLWDAYGNVMYKLGVGKGVVSEKAAQATQAVKEEL